MDSANIVKDSTWSWIVSLGAFIALMLDAGMIKCLGVLLPELREQFCTETWVVGLAISLAPGFGAVSCFLGSLLSKVTTDRAIVISFGIISSFGLMSASVFISITALFFGFLLTGFNIGAEGVTVAVLPIYFDKYYGIANSIGHIGMAIGIMILPPLTQMLLLTYGWRGSLLILSGLNLHIMLSGALLKTNETLTSEGNYPKVKNGENVGKSTSHNGLLRRIIRMLDLHLFANAQYVCVFLLHCALGYYYAGWLIYFVPSVEELGFSGYEASILATIGGSGNLFGCCIYPLLSEKVSSHKILYISKFVVCVGLLMLSFEKTFVGLAVSAFITMLGEALDGCGIHAFTFNVVDQKDFVSASNLLLVGYSVFSLISGFLTGWLRDYTGNYMLSFVLLSISSLMALIPMFINDCR